MIYDNLAPVYDFFVDWESRLENELPFLLRQLKRDKNVPSQPKVLDVACGTGRHAIALAQAGYKVSGADVSQTMIKEAQVNAKKAHQKIMFKTAGFGLMTEVFYPEKFNFVLCLGNSLPHVGSKEELFLMIQDCQKVLSPDGMLIIQQRNFDRILRERLRWMDPQFHAKNQDEWLFIRFYDFESNGLVQFNILTLHRKTGESWNMWIDSTNLIPIQSTELESVLGENGFSMLECYGSMRGEPYDPITSGDLIICAKQVKNKGSSERAY